MSRKVKMDFSDFVQQTRKALTKDCSGGIDFLYQVKVSRNTADFVWKKHIASDSIKVSLLHSKM